MLAVLLFILSQLSLTSVSRLRYSNTSSVLKLSFFVSFSSFLLLSAPNSIALCLYNPVQNVIFLVFLFKNAYFESKFNLVGVFEERRVGFCECASARHKNIVQKVSQSMAEEF